MYLYDAHFAVKCYKTGHNCLDGHLKMYTLKLAPAQRLLVQMVVSMEPALNTLLKSYRGVCLDTSSARCREYKGLKSQKNCPWQPPKLHNWVPCGNRQLVASREMVLGSLYTANLHYLPKLSPRTDTQAGMGGDQCRAISYAVQTWSSMEEQNDINDWACWVNAAPWTSPLSNLMGLRSSSSNSSGGSGIICLLVSMVPCLVRKSAISWYACSITCRINKAYL